MYYNIKKLKKFKKFHVVLFTKAELANYDKNIRTKCYYDLIHDTIGKKIYVIHQNLAIKRDYKICLEKIDQIAIIKNGIYIYTSAGELYVKEYNIKEIGETIFFTKDAAETKLKELMGENYEQ